MKPRWAIRPNLPDLGVDITPCDDCGDPLDGRSQAGLCGKCAAASELPLHFAVARDGHRGRYGKKKLSVHTRVLCGAWPPPKKDKTCELRDRAEVQCPACMVVKDVWLEQQKRKPLTLKRARILLRSRRLKTP